MWRSRVPSQRSCLLPAAAHRPHACTDRATGRPVAWALVGHTPYRRDEAPRPRPATLQGPCGSHPAEAAQQIAAARTPLKAGAVPGWERPPPQPSTANSASPPLPPTAAAVPVRLPWCAAMPPSGQQTPCSAENAVAPCFEALHCAAHTGTSCTASAAPPCCAQKRTAPRRRFTALRPPALPAPSAPRRPAVPTSARRTAGASPCCACRQARPALPRLAHVAA